MDQFEGKLAVITGAGSGIGRGLAIRCAKEGMRLAVADLHEGRLDSLKTELEATGAEVLACRVDVSEQQSVADFARDCESSMAVPDLLFNNAGILRVGETWVHSSEEWQKVFSINIMGVVHGLNAFLPAMLEAAKPAHIVNTGSVGSLVAAPGMAQYTAAKMAVRGITETLAHDLAARESQIGVSLLCPGPVLTAIGDDLMGIEATADVVAPTDHMMAGQPDFITPDEVAAKVFDGICKGDFWIFTHPLNAYLDNMTQRMLDGKNPEFSEVVFDANL